MEPATTNHHNLKQFDESEISGRHWKIMFVSRMGFFTDAYDLFIIVVMAMLKTECHPTPVETGLVTSNALLASAVGAVLFGRVADLAGKKANLWSGSARAGPRDHRQRPIAKHYLVNYYFRNYSWTRNRRRLSGKRDDHE